MIRIRWDEVQDRVTIIRHPHGQDKLVLAQTTEKVWLCCPGAESDTQELWKKHMTEWTVKEGEG